MRGRALTVFTILLTGCYASHGLSPDAGAGMDGSLDASTLDAGPLPALDAGPLPPRPWSDAPTQIAVSDSHACVVLESGRVACWGSRALWVLGPDTPDGCSSGAPRGDAPAGDFVLTPTLVDGVGDAVELALAPMTSCARTRAGEVYCWGGHHDERCRFTAARRVEGIADVVQVRGTAVNEGICAVHGDGTVSCWTTSRAPRTIPGLRDVRALSVGGWGTCAIVADDRVRCFNQQEDDPELVDVAVSGARDIATIGVGDFCILEAAGTVRCWGSARQLFGETFGEEPRVVPGLEPVVGISLDIFENACAWSSEGRVSCFGDNERGQLGDGTSDVRHRPVRVFGIADAVHVSMGRGLACAVRRSGGVACWGTGWIGNGEPLYRYDPVEVAGAGRAVRVSVRSSTSCALDGAGEVRCWGAWVGGTELRGSLVPRTLPARGRVRALCTHWCLVLEDGTVECPEGDSFRATLADLEGVSGLACGGQHDCAIIDGVVACEGLSDRGQLGDGRTGAGIRAGDPLTGLGEVVEIAAGAWHSCARTRAGDVLCWGANGRGQAGGASDVQMEPILVARGAERLSLGGDTSCILRGAAWSCWGDLSSLEVLCDTPCELPHETSTEVEIPIDARLLALSSQLTCAAPSVGAVRCSGYPTVVSSSLAGAAGVGRAVLGTEGAIDLATAGSHACAVSSGGRTRCWGFNRAGELGGEGAGSHPIPVSLPSPE